eukprot:m.305834 g.305834  ORF g.305834 m.305834 type:complete len:191 (-) comp16343_c1_seq4:2247-2819(-)
MGSAWVVSVRAREARDIGIGEAVVHIHIHGCGTGFPVARAVIEAGLTYTGVDLSAQMVEEARRNVDHPAATFHVADMATYSVEPASFDGVMAFSSIFHVPREQHAELFGRVAAWLRPGGWFVFSVGAQDTDGTAECWLDAGEMYWSNFSPDETQELLRAAGFEVASAEVCEQHEPGGVTTSSLWIMAQKR